MGAGLTADGNNNGEIDAGDYDVWRPTSADFGRAATAFGSSESPELIARSVPEPASIALWMLALPSLRRRPV